MSPPPGLARQRTTLSWQRTALDLVVVGGLLLQTAGGVGNPIRLVPGMLALLMAAVVLIIVRRSARPGRRPPVRHAVVSLGAVAVAIAVLAALLVLPW